MTMIHLKLHVFPTPRSFLRANKALSLNRSRDLSLGDTPNLDITVRDTCVEHAAIDVALGGALDAYRRSISMSFPQTLKSGWMILSSPNPPHDSLSEHDVDIDTIWHGDENYGTLEVSGTILLMLCAPNRDTYYLVTPDSQAHLHTWLSGKTIQDPLVHIIRTMQSPPVLSAFGPKVLAESFLAAWCAMSEPLLKIRDQAFLVTKLAYLSPVRCLESVPPQTEQQKDGITIHDIITLVSELSSDIFEGVKDQLIDCILKFWDTSLDEGRTRAYDMVEDVLKSQEHGRVWLCISSPLALGALGGGGNQPLVEVIGYVYLGRETAWTIALRNVYIKESWRGKKLASPLVHAACRYWLLEGGAPTERRKGAVTLFVEPSNKPATMAYLKAGFTMQDAEWVRNGFEGGAGIEYGHEDWLRLSRALEFAMVEDEGVPQQPRACQINAYPERNKASPYMGLVQPFIPHALLASPSATPAFLGSRIATEPTIEALDPTTTPPVYSCKHPPSNIARKTAYAES
ncbi:hypothetical protein FRC17_005861 [Serendipita sp. 399]|nr:hypothetical protein FRC17_005861 [Serendipita sp. 399]